MTAKKELLTKANDRMQVNIRPLEEDDLIELEWDGEYKHFRRLYRDIFLSSKLGKTIMWGVELLGVGIIGQVFVQFISGRLELANGTTRAYIFSFRIKPKYRNQKIGSKLLEVVETDLIERKFRWATLNVAKDNYDALRFYLRKGYRKIASETGYWTFLDDSGKIQEVYEPAWRLEKNLLA